MRVADTVFHRSKEIMWRDAKTQDLANTLWALTRVGWSMPEDLIKELESRHLPTIELVACLSALAEARNVSSSLWQKADPKAGTWCGHSPSARALGTLLWAHATAQVDPSPNLLKELRISVMSPQSLANSLWSLAKLQVDIPANAIDECRKILQKDLARFKPQEFASCVWAIGSMEKPAVEFFESLQLPDLRPFEDHHLSQVAWAFSSAGVRRLEVLELLASEMLCRNGFSLQAIANITWALKNLEFAQFAPHAAALHAHLQGLVARRLILSHGLPANEDVDSLLGILWANRENDVLTGAITSSLQRLGRKMDLARQSNPQSGILTQACDEHADTDQPRLQLEVPGVVVIYKPHGWEVDTVSTEQSGRKLSTFIRSRFDLEGFVSRLDTPSSGLLLSATCYEGLLLLQAQRELGRLERDYLVLCRGWVHGDGEITWKLRRIGRKTEVSVYGRPACTKVKLLAQLSADGQTSQNKVGQPNICCRLAHMSHMPYHILYIYVCILVWRHSGIISCYPS